MKDVRDPDDIDRQVRDALAVLLNEKQMRVSVRLLDKRLLILYLVGVVIVALMASGYQGLAKACQGNQANAETINMFLDRQIAAYATSPVLTPKQRQQRADMFTGLKQTVPSCPPKVW